jgi:cell wall-associated NlpC family hydrolase
VSAGRTVWLGVTAAVLASALAVAPVIADSSRADPSHQSPSRRTIAHSERVVQTREQQVRRAAAAVGRSRARLRSLNLSAEIAAEAYDGAEVRLQAANSAEATANLVLTMADRRVASGQAEIVRFATQAYESGGMSTLDAILSEGGTATLLRRVGALDAISASQRDTLQAFAASQIYQGVVSRNAQQMQQRAATAATAAAHDRAVAAAAVASQTALLASTRHREDRLKALLASARSHESRLQQERLAALARARARAVARREQARTPLPPPATGPTSPVPTGGSTAGTVSVATESAAVQVAEAQIGKPYVWGGAGPNSFDCSGLVMYAYGKVGVHLDHYTGDQWNEGVHLSRSQLRPGDLVFFAYDTSDPATIHHVGMYIGNGEMVQAPQTGENVQISPYDRPDYIGAVRPYHQ